MSRRGWVVGALATAGALASPRVATAHLVSTGAGPFYDGVAHFFVSFEEALPVLALALLAGLQGPRDGRWAIVMLPLGWLAGACLGLVRPSSLTSPLPVIALLIVPGVLAAWDRTLPVGVVAALAAGLGLLSGYANGGSMVSAGAGVLGILGAGSTAFVVVTLVAAAVAGVHVGWLRIAVRVAGSWLAALGVLAVGWLLKA